MNSAAAVYIVGTNLIRGRGASGAVMSGRRRVEQPARRHQEPCSAGPDGKPPQRRGQPRRPPRRGGGEGGGGITRERREGLREDFAANGGGLTAGGGRRGRAGCAR